MSLSRTHPRWVPYFFIAPFALVFGIFMFYPLVDSLFMSTYQSFGPQHRTFVGFENFVHVFRDADFRTALKNTSVYTLASVTVQLPLALGLALLLNRPGIKGKALFRLIFFSPSLVGLVFVAILFGLLLGSRDGLVNEALRAVIPGFPSEFFWLQRYVMGSLILASLWMYTGFNMVYFLAALQSVNQDTLEAASIDGANAVQRFTHVVLPEIKPVAGFVVLLSILGSLQLFELPWILFDGAGPEKRGLTLVMYLYQNGFEQNDLGYASAIGWVLAILLMFIAVLHRKLTREED
ncbi:MAG: sugar ABC transporter permease [Verrucomicrobia bacterium]|nr:sugar ABC transporter permease [Verrucomicrobiota bacterium]MCH8526280.1 sugar ABC transporter permease [Kiritimatiellia bacterium]